MSTQLFSNLEVIPFDFWGQPVYQDQKGVLRCPGFVGNTYMTNPWDYVAIGTAGDPGNTPGVAEVTVEKFRDLDKKKAAGTDGARLTIHGVEPALVEIRLTIWTPDQWEKLRVLWTTLFPGPQKITTTKTVYDNAPGAIEHTLTYETDASGNRIPHVVTTVTALAKTKKVTSTKTVSPIKAFDVYHPELQLHKIKSLVFLRGEGPAPGSSPRSRVFTMKCVEFMPPGKQDSTTSPDASAPQKTLFSKDGYPTPGAAGEGQKP